VQKIIVVEKSEVLKGAKGEYLKVFPIEGTPINIFDQSLWNLFGDGLAVELTLEQQGRWWNVTSAAPVAKELAEKQPSPAQKVQTIDSKNKAFALSYIKDLIVADRIPINKWLPYAEMFRRYLDGELTFDATFEKTMLGYIDLMLREINKKKEE